MVMLAVPASADAAKKKPRPRLAVNVLSLSQREIVKDRLVRIDVTAERTATVRMRAIVRRGKRKAVLVAATRELRVKRGRRTLVALKVLPSALRLFRTCSIVKVTISARARGLLPHNAAAPSRRLPPYKACPGSGGTGGVGTGGGSGGGEGGSGGGGSGGGGTNPAGPPLTYSIGLASRSIAPEADGKWKGGKVFLGGYGIGGGSQFLEGRAATGVLGEGPMVRALSISDGKKVIALADIEVQGWFVANKDAPYGLIDIRKKVEEETHGALDAENVTVQSDHTHGGADPMGVWGGVPLDYRRFMFEQAVAAILDAYNHREPANLFYGTAPARDLLSNQFDEDPFNDVSHNDVMDSDVRVLQARRSDDTPVATILNFSAHSTVLGDDNTRITGDWEQRANPMLEKRFGGKAMTIIGTFGRSQPNDRGCATNSKADQTKAEDALCILDSYAERVVDRAAQAAKGASLVAGDPKLAAASYLITDPAENGIVYLGLGVAGGPFGVEINRALTPPWVQGNVLGTVTASFRIGDVLLSAVPGEIYPQIALKVRDTVPGLRGYMTAGLANDQLGYIIAPFEAYPDPVRRTFFSERGDQVSPIGNDNYAFNVSLTLGERVTCSLLRGAGEVFGKGTQYREAYERCNAFANDLAFDHGADTGF
jgi:hypothetical protein